MNILLAILLASSAVGDLPVSKNPGLYGIMGRAIPGASFWGDGPKITDVNQGIHQNCPYTSFFAALAYMQPDELQKLAVDNGDGTYSVRHSAGWIRVDGKIVPTIYARPATNGPIWWPVLEKVYSFGFFLPWPTPETEYSISLEADEEEASIALETALARRYAVTAWTLGERLLEAPLADHAHSYSIMEITHDEGGRQFRLRNPYGDSLPDNGVVVITQPQFYANFFGNATVRSYRRIMPAPGIPMPFNLRVSP